MNYTCTMDSPIGQLTLASDGDNLTGLWLEGQKYFAATLDESQKQDLPVFAQTRKWLECYFSGKEPEIVLPLAPVGSTFRRAVWKILLEIPYGQVTTYGQIAAQLNPGKPHAYAQAVGGAVGKNPISIIIPCHRVVGADGSLTGYAGGIATKVRLLELERAPVERFYMPKRGTAL